MITLKIDKLNGVIQKLPQLHDLSVCMIAYHNSSMPIILPSMPDLHRYAYAFQSLTRLKTSPPVSPEKKHKTRVYGGILRVRHPHDEFLDRYALVQGRYTGKWSFPKGHSNEGEEPLACTLREIAEETGIEHLPEPVEYVRIGYGNYYVFHLDHMIDLIPRDTHEIIKTVWATIAEMELLSINVDVNRYRKSWLKRHQGIEESPLRLSPLANQSPLVNQTPLANQSPLVNHVVDQWDENKTMD